VRYGTTTTAFNGSRFSLTFLLWLFAFLVCLSVLGFIGFGYLRHALDAFPKLG